jgi:NAD(P)-dependent dehydrogenase (short-subunit alcohol dehydrogenase family)
MFNEALKGKRILVTGGGTGLGKEMSLGFATQGAEVYICGRRRDVLDEASREIMDQTDARVTPIIANVRDADNVDAMIEEIWQDGPLTGLVNNAGANFIAPTKGLSARGYEAIRSTIMDGSFFATLSCGKRWIAQDLPGSVVSNLVSWIWTGSAYVVPAAMAKAAVDNMTKSLAVEWGPHRIRVNAVSPGPFPTQNAWEKLNPIPETNTAATSSDQIPLRRFGEMDELRNLLIFLMADGCDFITGQTIAIDGAHHLAAPSTFADLARLSDGDWERVRASLRESQSREKVGRD